MVVTCGGDALLQKTASTAHASKSAEIPGASCEPTEISVMTGKASAVFGICAIEEPSTKS